VENLKKIFLHLSWIYPWFFLPVYISELQNCKIEQRELKWAIILFLFSFIGFLINHNLIYLFSWLLTLLIYLTRDHYKSFSLSLKPALVIISAGLIVGLILNIITGNRVGLFGGEPNFQGFILILFFCILLANGYSRAIIFSYSIIYTYISGSRTFILCFLLMLFLYHFRNNKKLLIYFSILVFSSLILVNYLFDFFVNADLVAIAGYNEGFDRIFNLFDSSSLERITLNVSWFSNLTDEIFKFLFGVSSSEYNKLISFTIGLEPHNSFLQKTANFGFIYLLFIIYVLVRILPLWIVLVLLFYSFFLHNVLSISFLVITPAYLSELVNTKKPLLPQKTI
jgi:hypothetical protein